MGVRAKWVGLLLGAVLSAACSDATDWLGAVTGIEGASARDERRAMLANDTTIMSENFDAYTSASQLGARQGDLQLVDGHGGTGKAVRFWYAVGQLDSWLERAFAPRGDLYVSFYYRTQAGANPVAGTTGGLDWLSMFRTDGVVHRFAVARAESAPTAAPEFSVSTTVGGESSRPLLQNVRKTPRFGTTNDDGWHHFVAHAVTGAGGYERVWVDGTRVLDTKGRSGGPPGAGIGRIRLPGKLAATAAFYLDVDDLRVWTAPSGRRGVRAPVAPPS